MCQVCNAQPGPFFCRDQVWPVLQPLLRGFLEEERALLLGFGDIFTDSSPVGKMGPSWEGGLVLGEVQPSWRGQLWYLPGGPGRQCPPGFEPGVLQFTGAVPALRPSVGWTGAPEGRGGCCSVSHVSWGRGAFPWDWSWGWLRHRELWLTSFRCRQRSLAGLWQLPAELGWDLSRRQECRGSDGSTGRAQLLPQCPGPDFQTCSKDGSWAQQALHSIAGIPSLQPTDPLCWWGLQAGREGGVERLCWCPFAAGDAPALPLCSARRSASSTSAARAGTGSTPWRSCATTAR